LYAGSLYKQKKYSESLEVFGEQIAKAEELYGKESEEYRWAYYSLANILAYDGDIERGSGCYMDLAGQYRDVLLSRLRILPSEKREAYLGGEIEIINNMVPFGVAAGHNEDEFTKIAYDGLLLTKGLLLASERTASQIIGQYGSAEDKNNLARLNDLQHQIAALEASGSRDTDKILSVYNEIKRIDSTLARSCAQYGNISSFADITYDDIKSKLKDDEVILDFTDYKPKSRPRQYVCFEIRKNQRYPKVHYVCNGAEIDSLLDLEKGKWSNLYTGEAARDMARIIGRPLADIISDRKTVYYVPSGVFHKLSIEAIPSGDSLLGDRHDFHRLSSAREILSPKTENKRKSGVLYGGLNYGKGIKPLSNSLAEVTDISGVIANPVVLSGSLGNKESFLKLTDAPDIIHFSTHGFYYNPSDKNLPASLKGYNDAMSLSGMVMAGGDMSSMEGLLTAEEISRVALADTEIACLASCHSGQGEVTAEGIYGLQRAFKKAGARSVIMNLWEASDMAAKCFMTNFYEDLVNGSQDRRKAFQNARDAVRQKYSSPYYWAGFVMID
ncbi:MAG: CHAT domain-containing protein, partial [Muribaculaceae bacterium]|nr:CHAT domain-containing protein [Muribaculaceae bacterium]